MSILIKYWFTFLLFLAVLTSIQGQAEYIENYHVELALDTSNQLTVKETIKVFANGDKIKRGIFRSLPLYRMDRYDRRIPIVYSIISIAKNGVNEPYFEKKEGGNLNIYIGDKDVILSPGIYTYEIYYITQQQVGFFQNHDELFWRAIGPDWEFPIVKASVDLELPDSAFINKYECFTFVDSRRNSKCISKLLDSTHYSSQVMGLGVREGYSIVVGFKKGSIAEPTHYYGEDGKSVNFEPTFWDIYGSAIITALVSLVLILYFVLTWIKHGRDPKGFIAYPIFSPPQDISPAAMGMVYYEQYWNDLLSVAMVQLAVKNYIHIEEEKVGGIFGFLEKSKYTITKMKNSDSSLAAEEIELLDQLFKKDDIIELDGTYESRIATTQSVFRKTLNKDFSPMLNAGRNLRFITFPIMIVIALVTYIVIYDDGLRLGVLILGVLTFFFFFGIVVLRTILGAVFWKKRTSIIVGIVTTLGIGVFFLFGIGLISELKLYFQTWDYTLITLMIIIISIAIYYYLIKRPDEKKLKLQSEIEGFKMYMTMAEEKLIQQFNPPKITPEIFEAYLPYAIALGVEEVWGEKFSDSLSRSMNDPSQYQSSWYSGSRSFSSSFTKSLSSSMANTVSSSSTKPSSSGSGSYGSGFSGGSSSGGGGGGGGGGW